MSSATAEAHPNIAFIKYWGNVDDRLRLPASPSISMNLAGLHTRTTVTWNASLSSDQLILNDSEQQGAAQQRVSRHLDVIRERLGMSEFAQVESVNNFPMGAGIASSAAAFAALTVAAVGAAGASLSERELSTLARRGSGSASRSVPGGFVVWYTGDTHDESYAESIAAPDHWNLVDVIAVVSEVHKRTGSTDGHITASSSDLQTARLAGAVERLEICKNAVLARNFPAFADVVEHDSNLMHAVMMTSRPPLFYWQPTTLTLMQMVREWRLADGLRVCYTLDAGPNVHCLCLSDDADEIVERLQALDGVMDVRRAEAGDGARIVSELA